MMDVSSGDKSMESSNIDSLKWPYLIVGIGHITFSLEIPGVKIIALQNAT